MHTHSTILHDPSRSSWRSRYTHTCQSRPPWYSALEVVSSCHIYGTCGCVHLKHFHPWATPHLCEAGEDVDWEEPKIHWTANTVTMFRTLSISSLSPPTSMQAKRAWSVWLSFLLSSLLGISMVLGCTSNAGRTPHKRELRIAEDEHDGGMRLQNSFTNCNEFTLYGKLGNYTGTRKWTPACPQSVSNSANTIPPPHKEGKVGGGEGWGEEKAGGRGGSTGASLLSNHKVYNCWTLKVRHQSVIHWQNNCKRKMQ